MAGHRRKARKPFRAVAGAQRRHAMFVERMGRARTAGQRVSAAASYLTGALSGLSPGAAAALADVAVQQLASMARRAESELERESHQRRVEVNQQRRERRRNPQ